MKRVSWRELAKICDLAGWTEDRSKGDHLTMVKPGTARPVVIKMDSDLGEDIVQSVKRTAGLSSREFHALLEQVRGRKRKRKPKPTKSKTAEAEQSSERPN